MKKLLITTILSLAALSTNATTIDPQFFKGGARAHFLVSTGMGATCMLTSGFTGLTENQCLTVSIAVGLAKEIKDSQEKLNDFSKNDLFWDIAGSYIGVKFGGFVITPKKVEYIKTF